ncbi:MAG: TetR family transcriptional regulator [Actinomycetota bacterium]
MADQNPTDIAPSGAALLRNEPVQARSTARLASLLDAAAAIIDEIGYERLTTAMVAERAGASIGTVYRYFPDRIVVLQSLSARSLGGFVDGTRAMMLDPAHETWWDAVKSCIDGMTNAFRTMPGFRSLRLGDVLDVRPALSAQSGSTVVAAAGAAALAERFGLPTEGLAHRLEVVIVVADSLLSRAFTYDSDGDPTLIDEATTISKSYLTSFYGDPRGA